MKITNRKQHHANHKKPSARTFYGPSNNNYIVTSGRQGNEGHPKGVSGQRRGQSQAPLPNNPVLPPPSSCSSAALRPLLDPFWTIQLRSGVWLDTRANTGQKERTLPEQRYCILCSGQSGGQGRENHPFLLIGMSGLLGAAIHLTVLHHILAIVFTRATLLSQ